MNYQVLYEKKAIKSLKKIEKKQQNMIIAWIEKNLVNTDNPYLHGKPLKGQLNKYWRYRIGSYRILAEIDQNKIKIIIFNISHRRDIYK